VTNVFKRLAIVTLPTVTLLGCVAVGTASAGTRPADATSTPAATCQQQSTLAGTHFSDLKIAQTARANGFHGNALVISIAVALAESSGWTKAVLINTDCSRDRGLWQINSRWHGEVPDSQAFDPNGCARAAYTISSGGSNWQPWTTYNNGAYQQFMARARTAAQQAGG
jgi:hypothetical protein